MADEKPNLWSATESYEQYMGRWSRKVAPLFMAWLDAPPQKDWIDIGCGTGEVTSQIARLCAPSKLIGIDPSEGFISFAGGRLENADFRVGTAVNLELPDSSQDFAVCGRVLNFVADKAKAISEMVRVVRPGGTVALYVWDYAGHMQIMRYFFETAREFDPGSEAFDDGVNAPICRPQPLADAFSTAGLKTVETTPIDIPTPFVDFDDYWTPFLGGTGSAPRYCMSLEEGLRNQIKEAIRAKLPTGPDGEILLAARAWAVKGRV